LGYDTVRAKEIPASFETMQDEEYPKIMKLLQRRIANLTRLLKIQQNELDGSKHWKI